MKGAEMTAADTEDNRLLVGDGATDNTTSATTAPATGIVGLPGMHGAAVARPGRLGPATEMSYPGYLHAMPEDYHYTIERARPSKLTSRGEASTTSTTSVA